MQPGSVQTQRDLSVALNRVGEIRQLMGDFAGAVEVFEESLELARGYPRTAGVPTSSTGFIGFAEERRQHTLTTSMTLRAQRGLVPRPRSWRCRRRRQGDCQAAVGGGLHIPGGFASAC